MENDQLPDAVGTNGLHAARYHRINEANGVALPEDGFVVCEHLFACRHHDVSTYGERKASEEFNRFHHAGGVEHGLGKAGRRAHRSSPHCVRRTYTLCDSKRRGLATWLLLAQRGTRGHVGKGEKCRGDKSETITDCHGRSREHFTANYHWRPSLRLERPADSAAANKLDSLSVWHLQGPVRGIRDAERVPGQHGVGTLTVTPAPETISPTPNPASMTYGGAIPSLTPSYSGFVVGEGPGNLTGTATCSTTATSTSVVGAYTSVCSGASSKNYTIAYPTGVVNVGKASSATVIMSNAPSRAIIGQIVTVSFSVSPQFTGTPSGTVTTRASTTNETCSAALTAGSGRCPLTFATGGSRTLTATYSGGRQLPREFVRASYSAREQP